MVGGGGAGGGAGAGAGGGDGGGLKSDEAKIRSKRTNDQVRAKTRIASQPDFCSPDASGRPATPFGKESKHSQHINIPIMEVPIA